MEEPEVKPKEGEGEADAAQKPPAEADTQGDKKKKKKKKGKGEVEEEAKHEEVEESPNTFETEPPVPFRAAPIRVFLEKILVEMFEGKTYSPELVQTLPEASERILASCYNVGFERYKIIVTIKMVEKMWQEARSVSHFLWDAQRDGYSSYSYETASFVVVGVVYFLYYE